MLSSVGTSKCNSPACVEARARRAAAYNLEERRRATVPPYHDSVDSLRDSPHSERSVLPPHHADPPTHSQEHRLHSSNVSQGLKGPPTKHAMLQPQLATVLLRMPSGVGGDDITKCTRTSRSNRGTAAPEHVISLAQSRLEHKDPMQDLG